MISSKKTIKSKLLTSYLLITIVTVILMISILLGFVYLKKTEVTINLATQLSKIMGENLAASLSFNDKQSAKNILNSLQADKTIEAAFVYNKNNKLFSSYLNNIDLTKAFEKIKLLHGNSSYHDLHNIIVTSDISLDNEPIGKIILLYNTDDVKNTLKQVLLILLFVAVVILLISSMIASLLQKKLTAPIYTLVNTMEDILVDNNYTKTIDVKSDDEFQTVFDGFNKMLNTIQKDKLKLEALANTDPLTKLNNRRHFYELVTPLLAASKRENKVSSVFMMDIDHFKNINDTYGHDIGDIILKDFANLILNNIREGDILSRFGGEEFVLFLPNINCKNALIAAEKIRKAVENLVTVENIKFTISIGVSEVISDVDSAIKEADNALYTAKESGRNRVEHSCQYGEINI